MENEEQLSEMVAWYSNQLAQRDLTICRMEVANKKLTEQLGIARGEVARLGEELSERNAAEGTADVIAGETAPDEEAVTPAPRKRR